MTKFVRSISVLAALGALSVTALAQTAGMEAGSQTAGMPPHGSQPAGMPSNTSPVLPGNGVPFGAAFSGFPQPGVPAVMRGFSSGLATTQTRIVQSGNEWEYVYRYLNQAQNPNITGTAPDVANFLGENLAVILLGQDFGANASPSVESIDFDGYQTLVRYVVWVPLNTGNQGGHGEHGKDDKDHHGDKDKKDGQGHQGQRGQDGQSGQSGQGGQGGNGGNHGQGGRGGSGIPNSPSTHTTISAYTLFPYIVVRYEKHAGATKFVGRVQYYRPYGWGN